MPAQNQALFAREDPKTAVSTEYLKKGRQKTTGKSARGKISRWPAGPQATEKRRNYSLERLSKKDFRLRPVSGGTSSASREWPRQLCEKIILTTAITIRTE